ncbi:hypothetical protein L6452_34918 [Arctium lappa]|uniref:Uncharacterized protein n=1 Tax=Arctium lappa TaxID=4217 RepID=A0ACB8YJS5_ARCLA|nr:hypothetical protein L6452_34918 [Arctium lappa]
MKAIINGPDIPMITVKGQPATDSSPEILGREVPKPYEFFNEKQKEHYKIEEETLIYLTMAIPNDIYNRVDSQSTAKAISDELAKEFEGSEAFIQAKQNLCINACEGFHAKEGELLLDTYSRYNIILNDLRRNNIAKSASVINYKFIKNLNPEWKNFAINLQMSKNIAQENVTNIFCTLTRHGDEVRSINNDSNNLKDSVALIAGKGSVSSARSKQKVSKALVTEVTDSNSASSEEELEIDSDPDIQKFSEDLALITCRFKKSFGKKRFYSKPKKEDIREGKREEKREERKDEPGRCYNCGKFGHFSRDSKFKKVKNSEYYARKTLIAKKVEEGKVLMDEEENWLFQSSDDKEQAHFTQVSYMAKLDGDDEDSETQSEDANSELLWKKKKRKETLIYLTMAIPNDIYNRVDSQSTAKAIWDELAKEFEGSEASIQAKQNLCINACEGFHAKEGELLLDTYSRYNIILNDLRRNNIAKSASVINYKFIKNLNPEWKNFAINLQMSKNIAQENVTNIFCTLTRHGDEVRSINSDSNYLKDSVALIAGKGSVSSARSKQKVSKALVTEVTDSNSASSEEELKIDSDPDIQKFSEDLALITCRFKKSFGKKRFYSKPKCYNCGKFGHFSRDSKFKKVKNSEYYARKSLIAKKAEEGKVLMAEEENWLFQSSDDKEQAHFTQVSYMAKLDGDDEDSETQSKDANSEVSDNSELIESLMAQIHGMKGEFALLKGKLTSAHQSVLSFCDENAILKVVVEEKEKEKNDLKAEKASLKEKISGLETDLVNLNAKKGEFQMKFEVCYKERNEACTKIKQLEDINMKRGQTEQTLNLLTNKLQDERFYKLKPGLGVPINKILKKAPEHLYNIDKFGSVIRPIPDIRENFVEASTSTSLTETKGREEMGENKSGDTDSQNLFKSVGFQYSDLNKSYETRKIEFTESESLFTTPSIESVNTNIIPPETACKYDEYESDVDPSTIPSVSNPIASKPLLVEEVEEEVVITNESCVQNDKEEFIESMTEEIFSEMMNASDSNPVSDLKLSNSVNDNTSELMKQIDMLQQSLDEVEDENFDLKHKLEKSLKVNQELCTEINDLKITLFKNASNDKQMFKDPSWKVRTNPEFDAPAKPSVVYSDCPEYPLSIFEKGETSNSTRKEPPSKLETNKVAVSVSDIKGNGVGRSKKNKDSSLNKNDRLSSETFLQIVVLHTVLF